MIDPREEFRAELASLRRSVIRAIQEGVPSNIDEGMQLYRQLLERMLDRFATLYRTEGPRYEPFPLVPDPSGQQMEWLRSDYQDFLEQGLVGNSAGAMRSILGGLFGASASCIRGGDVGALALFLDLLVEAWSAGEGNAAIDGGFARYRAQLLDAVRSLCVVAISGPSDNPRQQGVVPAVLARLIKCLSDFMKSAIDNMATDDLRAAAGQMVESFVTGIDLSSSVDPGAEDQTPLVRVARQLSAGALVGIDGWILYRATHGMPSDDAKLLRSAIQGATRQINPWDALPLTLSPMGEDFFGWRRWELFSDNRSGFGISMPRM